METIRIPSQRINAEFAAADANRESRTVPMTFYTGATVLQFDWQSGLHKLTLSMDPKHVRLGELSSGRAPFTMGHADSNDPSATLGVIENARIEGGKAKADVRFSKRPDVEPIFNDVLDGILPNVSLGARLHRLKETTAEGEKIKSFLATDWEPYAVALVGVGADAGAHFAATDVGAECEIELAARATAPEEKQSMSEPINAAPAATVNVDEVKLAAQNAERARVVEITKIANIGKLDATLAATHVANGTSVEEFRRVAFEALAARSNEVPMTPHSAVITDKRDKIRLCAGAQVDALLSRKNKVDADNPYRGMSVARLAEQILNDAGTSTRGMSKAQIAELSMHATADFPLILADSGRKQMLAAYATANPTYRIWTKASTTPDFKTMSRLRLSETPSFLKVAEGAQIQLGTMTESREQYAIATYGRGVSFTRQMLINDDLGAFNDLLSAFGVQAARLENKTVYAILTANANMSDSAALFVDATHFNYGSGVLGNTALDLMFTKMATQKGLDGSTVLNLAPRYLIVPKAKEVTARSTQISVGPNVKISDQNLFAGRLEVIADAELDATSTAEWYGAADPSIAPGIEYAHLEGAEGPQAIRKENEDAILGVQIYMFLDFGAKAVDWRPLYKSTGA